MIQKNTEIRRRVDGSIDTDYYIRLCHKKRSKSAWKAVGRGKEFLMPSRWLNHIRRNFYSDIRIVD